MEEKKTFAQKVIAVQRDLKAPKSQYNGFGGYRYRSAEDILMAAKPLLAEQGLLLTVSDDVVIKSEATKVRFYIKATATISDGEGHQISVDAWAREADSKTKMDDAQVTGGASSYARKYALNGLFLIDDTKDPDATNDHSNTKVDEVIEQIKAAKSRKELTSIWNAASPELQADARVNEAMQEACRKYPKGL